MEIALKDSSNTGKSDPFSLTDVFLEMNSCITL